MSEAIRTIDDVPQQVIEQVGQWLGQPGREFFANLYHQYGQLNVVYNEDDHDLNVPHAVHFHEGMQVRNFLRTQTELSKYADDHTFDDLWEPIVLRALEIR